MNPLKSRTGTVIAGIVLSLLLTLLLQPTTADNAPSLTLNWLEIAVWFHVIVGITWVGLLYYFNAIQIPAVAAAIEDETPGPAAINRYIAPRALFWFRWAAILTWLTGASALYQMEGLLSAFTFAEGWRVLGMGAWLGTIMLFNVWFIIWPNQQKILGMKSATPEEVARSKTIALLASRFNTMLSFPMLLGMTAFGHGLPF